MFCKTAILKLRRLEPMRLLERIHGALLYCVSAAYVQQDKLSAQLQRRGAPESIPPLSGYYSRRALPGALPETEEKQIEKTHRYIAENKIPVPPAAQASPVSRIQQRHACS